MEKESFVFYKSFYDAIKELDEKCKSTIYLAIFEYAFYGNEIKLDGVCKAIFLLIKPQIDANKLRYENGKKGGRPKKEETNDFENKNQRLSEEKTTGFENKNQRLENKKPNVNVNVNENVNENENVNDNIKEKNVTKKEKHKFGKFGRIKLTNDEYDRLIKEFGKEFIDNQINLLDEYVESNNNKNKYSNFNLVLRKSIRDNWFKKKEPPPGKETDVPSWFYMNFDKEEEMSDEDKRELEAIKNGTYKP